MAWRYKIYKTHLHQPYFRKIWTLATGAASQRGLGNPRSVLPKTYLSLSILEFSHTYGFIFIKILKKMNQSDEHNLLWIILIQSHIGASCARPNLCSVIWHLTSLRPNPRGREDVQQMTTASGQVAIASVMPWVRASAKPCPRTVSTGLHHERMEWTLILFSFYWEDHGEQTLDSETSQTTSNLTTLLCWNHKDQLSLRHLCGSLS